MDSLKASVITNITKRPHRQVMEITSVKGTKLLPFQKKGIEFLMSTDGKAILADEMGLGKTIQALGYLYNAERAGDKVFPALIICPLAVKYNWEKEAVKWLKDKKIQVVNSYSNVIERDSDVVVINYDIVYSKAVHLIDARFKTIVLDECHKIKNPQTQRTKAVKKVATQKHVKHIIPISGTPAVNRPIELYNSLTLVAPHVFDNYWRFAQRYCGARRTPFGWDVNGASHKDELFRILKPYMIRRTKSEVLTDLPEKTRAFIPVELENREAYLQAENDTIAWIRENKGKRAANNATKAETLVRLSLLRQLAASYALPSTIEWISTFLESSENKLVVFAVHKEIIDALCTKFKKVCVKIDGETTGKGREAAVTRFQESPSCRLFIGNINAAGVGITLTAASDVAFLELPWTPGDLDQAEDRCHRIGQRSSVNVWYLLAKDTIAETMAKMIDQKRIILSQILNGQKPAKKTILSTLLQSYDEENR